VRLFHRRRPALQPLDEAAAYARCHGERSEEIVSIERLPPPEPPPPEPAPLTAQDHRTLTGESLREAFELRLRSRRPYFR
jgi:hypothetical protein